MTLLKKVVNYTLCNRLSKRVEDTYRFVPRSFGGQISAPVQYIPLQYFNQVVCHRYFRINFQQTVNKLSKPTLLISTVRCKSKKSDKGKQLKDSIEESSDEEDDDGEEIILEKGKNFRDVKTQVSSLRMDAILKTGLGISRNKAEDLFYGSKIRINKEKVKKKSVSLLEGDVIDVLRGTDTTTTTEKTEISRLKLIKICSFNENSGTVVIILRKFPKLYFNKYGEEEVEDSR